MGDSTPCKVHVAMLAFSNKASLKPFPSGHAALLLAETILHEGFRTGDEPLHVKHMPAAAVKGEEFAEPLGCLCGRDAAANLSRLPL